MFSKLSHTFHSQINTVLVISRKSVMIIFHFLSPAHSDPDALKMFLQEVASVAPTLPFYYYHIPAITGVNGWCHWRWIFVFHSHEHLRRHVGRQIIFTECEMCFFFLQCWWEICLKVLRRSFPPFEAWSSAGLTWWTLASVSATVRLIGRSSMAWTKSALSPS